MLPSINKLLKKQVAKSCPLCNISTFWKVDIILTTTIPIFIANAFRMKKKRKSDVFSYIFSTSLHSVENWLLFNGKENFRHIFTAGKWSSCISETTKGYILYYIITPSEVCSFPGFLYFIYEMYKATQLKLWDPGQHITNLKEKCQEGTPTMGLFQRRKIWSLWESDCRELYRRK